MGAWYALIFALSHSPGLEGRATQRWLEGYALGDLNTALRVLAHMGVFGILAVLLYRALGGGDFRPRRGLAAGALALTAILAVADEFHQHLVPARHGRAIDVGIDLLGAALGLAVVTGWASWRWRRGPGPSNPAPGYNPRP